MTPPLDAKAHNPREGGPSFSVGHRLYRAVWQVAWLILARWTPRPMHRWRGAVARAFGATIAPRVSLYPDVKIWHPANLIMRDHACLGPRVECYNMALIELDAYATVSQGAYLCAGAHDIHDSDFQLITRPIRLKTNAWIAAQAFVGPGVTVGEGAVLGARGVAMKDLEPWEVYSGNPAVRIGVRKASSRDASDGTKSKPCGRRRA